LKVNAARKNGDDGGRYVVELLWEALDRWRVYKGDVGIGSITKGPRPWERAAKGMPYVAARGQVTAWYIAGERLPYDTRGAAIRELVNRAAERLEVLNC
jgi:hypothetical protein